MTTKSLATIVSLLLFAAPALGEGPVINPGLWKTRSVAKMPMMPEPQVKESSACISDEDATKDFLDTMTDDGRCKVTKREVSGNTVNFEMTCGDHGGKWVAKGEMTATGDEGQGKMTMNGKIGEQDLQIEQSWKTTRVGDCQ